MAPLTVPMDQLPPQNLWIWLLSQFLKEGSLSSTFGRVNGSRTSVSNTACSFNKLPSTLILCHKPPRLHSHIHCKCQTKQAKNTLPLFSPTWDRILGGENNNITILFNSQVFLQVHRKGTFLGAWCQKVQGQQETRSSGNKIFKHWHPPPAQGLQSFSLKKQWVK